MRLLNKIKLITKVENLKYKTMSSYCLKCRKNTESINLRVLKISNSKAMILSKYAICGSKKWRFIKKTRSKWNINYFRF